MSDLINALSKDMGIVPYLEEPIQLYKSRLIYSAICEWMRYTTQDLIGETTYCKSKHYLLNRCTEILNSFLECEPLCRYWFIGEEENSVVEAIRSIREKMICAGELVEIGEKTQVSIPEYKEVSCALGYQRIVGFNNFKEVTNMVGITRIKASKNSGNTFFEENHYDIDSYIQWVYENGEWSDCDNINQFEFFDTTSKRIPSQSWSDKPLKSQEYHLARITLYNGYHEYWALKYQKGKWKSKALESVLQDYNEERRILLGLRKMNDNMMIAEFEYRAPVIVLRLFCRLPVREEIILDTYAWPLNNFNDKLWYVIPYKLWDSIKEFLTNDLGIKLKEKR